MLPGFRRPIVLLALLACVATFALTRPGPPPPPRLSAADPFAWLSRVTPEARAHRPNLLLVVYDARRRDDFSFGRFGNRRGDTPFLADFKDQSAYFDSAVAPGCWTVPVHGSMFSGLGVCELGADYYSPDVFRFSEHSSLAQILTRAGYHTVAWADHPLFYNRFEPYRSLVWGFEQFSVVNDFKDYVVYTNLGRSDRAVLRRHPFADRADVSMEQLDALVERFNGGGIALSPARDGDLDPEHGIYLAKLDELFRESGYFERRYRREFEREVFPAGDGRPYFLFVNLHMCMIAEPDPALYSRWILRTLMLNARHLGKRLEPAPAGADVRQALLHQFQALGLRHGMDSPERYLKHVFDNRLYDACFRGLWEFLRERGLTRNTVTIVTSDHGMSFSENGESYYAHGGARPHEYITRVPLVVRFPQGSGLETLHGTYQEKVSLTDVFPTLVELALGPGVLQRPEPVRGLSLVRRLREKLFDRVLITESALRPESYRYMPGVVGYSKAIYDGDEKLILAPDLYTQPPGVRQLSFRLDRPGGAAALGLAKAGSLTLLYDLAGDPLEAVNLAAQRPASVARLTRMLDGTWDCLPAASSGPAQQHEQDSLETLKALGYLN